MVKEVLGVCSPKLAPGLAAVSQGWNPPPTPSAAWEPGPHLHVAQPLSPNGTRLPSDQSEATMACRSL